MTDKQWTQVKNYLNCYGKAKLKIDDHYITLTRETTRNRLYYSMNIDDATEAERELTDEEKKKFCNKHTKHMKDSTYEWYGDLWYSFGRMKSHFIKNNKSIESIEPYIENEEGENLMLNENCEKNSKGAFSASELLSLLKAIDPTVHSCTYTVRDNGEEIVAVWFDDGNFFENVCVTGDSLAQLAIDVLKKVIM